MKVCIASSAQNQLDVDHVALLPVGNKAIISHLNKQADVTFIKNMPYGTAKEVVATNTIKTITETAKHPEKTRVLHKT